MKTARFRILTSTFVAGILGAIGMMIWWIKEPSTASVALGEITPSNQQISGENKVHTQRDGEPRYTQRDGDHQNNMPEHTANAPIGPLRLQSIARHTYLQLMDSSSLNVGQAVVDLLDLNPGQIKEVNQCMKRFLTALKAAELNHAAVVHTKDGGEEIVVEPFDRSGLLNELRRNIADKVDENAANFLVEQAPYDYCLALGNSELRLSIEHGEDGLDRFVVTQTMLRRDALDATTPIQKGSYTESPTSLSTSKGLLGKNIDPRFAHLFSAVDTLPHRK